MRGGTRGDGQYPKEEETRKWEEPNLGAGLRGYNRPESSQKGTSRGRIGGAKDLRVGPRKSREPGTEMDTASNSSPDSAPCPPEPPGVASAAGGRAVELGAGKTGPSAPELPP